MRTKTELMEWAAARGSKAKTWDGAIKFLRKNGTGAKSIFPRQWRKYNNLQNPKTKKSDYKFNFRAEKICVALGKIDVQTAESYAEKLTENFLNKIEKNLEINWPYRKSQSSWAGGEHTVTIWLADQPSVSAGSERVWSNNQKWSGNNSYARIKLTQKTLAALNDDLIIGGLITIDAEYVAPREYRAQWLRQGRGFELKIESGYIIRGHHVAIDNHERAKKIAATARQKTLTTQMQARDKKRLTRTDAKQYRDIWVSIADSLSAGNCKPATEEFSKKIKKLLGIDGELGAVRADIILRQRDDIYVRRAINAAMNRGV